jgi:hypothetical protein
MDIKTFNSKKLCQIILSYRYLKLNKELSIQCMEELGRRRANGDQFDFESYLKEISKELPELNFSIPNIKDILLQAIKK